MTLNCIVDISYHTFELLPSSFHETFPWTLLTWMFYRGHFYRLWTFSSLPFLQWPFFPSGHFFCGRFYRIPVPPTHCPYPHNARQLLIQWQWPIALIKCTVLISLRNITFNIGSHHHRRHPQILSRCRKCLEYRNPYCNFRFSLTGTRIPSTGNWEVAKNAVMCMCIKITAQIVLVKIMIAE